jgi:hypothetical protein
MLETCTVFFSNDLFNTMEVLTKTNKEENTHTQHL